jgi:flagellar protein FlaG
MIRHSDGPVSALSPLPVASDATRSAKPAGAATAVPAAPAPTRGEVEQAVSSANEQMHSIAPSLQFEIDADTQQVVIRLVDRQDQRVLRQVPSAEMLAIARALERMQALLVRTRA